MKADNSLTREFLLNYPVEAARVLEQVSIDNVVAFFNELPVLTVASVMTHMLPETAAACLGEMAALSAAKLVNELPVSTAARCYRLLSTAKQDELSELLSEKSRSRIQHYLQHPPESVGALMDPDINRLPGTVTVGEAIRRIKRLGHPVSCDIYIIDDAHHLTGIIDLGKLLTSGQHARLGDIMACKIQPVYAHATAAIQLTHPGWVTRRKLPVVERDNTLIGALDYSRLHEAVSKMEMAGVRDPFEDLLSLAGLYWVSMVQLIDSMFSKDRRVERERL